MEFSFWFLSFLESAMTEGPDLYVPRGSAWNQQFNLQQGATDPGGGLAVDDGSVWQLMTTMNVACVAA